MLNKIFQIKSAPNNSPLHTAPSSWWGSVTSKILGSAVFKNRMSNYIVWLSSPKPNMISKLERGGCRQSTVVCALWRCESVVGACGKRHTFQRQSTLCLTNQKSCKYSKSGLQAPGSGSTSQLLGSSLPQALQQEGGTRLEVGIDRIGTGWSPQGPSWGPSRGSALRLVIAAGLYWKCIRTVGSNPEWSDR